jgi:hypothetical protein
MRAAAVCWQRRGHSAKVDVQLDWLLHQQGKTNVEGHHLQRQQHDLL